MTSVSRTGLLLTVPFALLGVLTASAAEKPILAPGAKLEKVASGCKFTEGPAWDGKGNLYFSDGPNNRIMVYREGGKAKVWKTNARSANGMLFDAQGRLITCNSQSGAGGRTVTRYEKNGKVTVLADRYQGKKLNSPNDLAVDRQGRIYFTDPRYGELDGMEQDKQSVYRIEKGGKLTRVIDDVQVPNGILITPDNKTLYVADNSPNEGENRTLIAYNIAADGTVKRRKVLYDLEKERGMDGMVLDVDGNIYATAGLKDKTGVYVFSPAGKLLQFIRTPETACNCTFGGPDLKTLYITAETSLYRIRMQKKGWLVYPKAK
jgi:gluconolactonase